MVLQVVEHRPAVHHRQREVEHDRIRLVFVRQREAGVAAGRDDPLEAALARDVEHRAREVGLVLDDEDDAVAFLHVLAVVLHAREQHGGVELGRRGSGVREHPRSLGDERLALAHELLEAGLDRRELLAGRDVERHPGDGEVERERASPARLGVDADLAAEQARDLAADRQAEAGAAVAA